MHAEQAIEHKQSDLLRTTQNTPNTTPPHTHENQCEKNRLSLLIFLRLSQALVTVTLIKVAATLTGVE